MSHPTSQQIQLFKSVFKGREDVFAVRWEKGNKSGYMPAYFFDIFSFKAHKMKGGTFKNFPDKSYLKLDDGQIEKHLNGIHQIGVYPLLKDNTSWFIAADFDKTQWQDDCRTFMDVCRKNDMPAFLERSRSGNGGHVWIFFEQPYPAYKSRQIITHMLEEAGLTSKFSKEASFDRLFPNQDTLSGKGLGNLIALPLNKNSWSKGNGCFIHPVTLEPFADQWALLQSMKRISVSHLDNLLQRTSGSAKPTTLVDQQTLQITLSSHIRLSNGYLPTQLISFLKKELIITNTAYIIKKKGREKYL